MSKMHLTVDGFNEMANKIKQLQGDAKSAVNKAIKESHNIVTTELQKNIAKHRLTGRTEAALRKEAQIKWDGDKAEDKFGFEFPDALPVVIMDHGSPKQSATPITKPAINRSRAKVKKVQEDILKTELRKLQ